MSAKEIFQLIKAKASNEDVSSAISDSLMQKVGAKLDQIRSIYADQMYGDIKDFFKESKEVDLYDLLEMVMASKKVGEYPVEWINHGNDKHSIKVDGMKAHKGFLSHPQAAALYKSLSIDSPNESVNSYGKVVGILDMNILESIEDIKKGAFHRWLGKSPDEKITDEDIEKGLESDDEHVRKMAEFAKNARLWKHESVDEGKEQSPTSGTRLISKHGYGEITAELRKSPEYNEFQVHYYKNGKHMGEGPVSYHDDKQDAIDTMNHELERMNRKA